MWFSIGDRLKIVRQENADAKSGKTTLPLVVLLCACFVVSTFFFTSRVPASHLIRQIVYIVSLCAIAIMGIVKFIRIKQEVDISLVCIFAIILSIFLTI